MTSGQFIAAGRHLGTLLGAVLAIFGALGWINPSQSDAINTAVNQISTAVGALIPVLTTLYAGWSASPSAQAESLTKEVPGTVVITTAAIANPTSNPNIVCNTTTQAVKK